MGGGRARNPKALDIFHDKFFNFFRTLRDDLEQLIIGVGDRTTFDNLRFVLHEIAKLADGFLGMVEQGNMHIGARRQPEFARIQQGNIA